MIQENVDAYEALINVEETIHAVLEPVGHSERKAWLLTFTIKSEEFVICCTDIDKFEAVGKFGSSIEYARELWIEIINSGGYRL
jgi:hypothetical protein